MKVMQASVANKNIYAIILQYYHIDNTHVLLHHCCIYSQVQKYLDKDHSEFQTEQQRCSSSADFQLSYLSINT